MRQRNRLGRLASSAVQGWDASPACVEGAIRNVELMFGKDIGNRCKISLREHATRELAKRSRRFDCAIATLPWGQNSVLYYNENVRILKSLPKSLWPRAPCAFTSIEVELQKYMKRLGYHVLGSAYIPPQNLDLPSSKKARLEEKRKEATMPRAKGINLSCDSIPCTKVISACLSLR
jgi:hypothetical protein